MYVTEHTAVMCNHEFDQLDDYSCSLPTGTRIGKMWKRRKDYHDETKGWLMGEYTECNPPRNDRVAIIWRTIEVDPTEEEWRSLIIDEFMAYLKERGLQKPDSCGVKVDSATMKITLMHKYGIQVPLDFNLYDPNCFDDMAEYMRLYF